MLVEYYGGRPCFVEFQFFGGQWLAHQSEVLLDQVLDAFRCAEPPVDAPHRDVSRVLRALATPRVKERAVPNRSIVFGTPYWCGARENTFPF